MRRLRSPSAPPGNADAKPQQRGPITVSDCIKADFFAFLSLVRKKGGTELNSIVYDYLGNLAGKNMGNKEFTELYVFAVNHCSPGFRAELDSGFVYNQGSVFSRMAYACMRLSNSAVLHEAPILKPRVRAKSISD
jgi:hypothetical protein